MPEKALWIVGHADVAALLYIRARIWHSGQRKCFWTHARVLCGRGDPSQKLATFHGTVGQCTMHGCGEYAWTAAMLRSVDLLEALSWRGGKKRKETWKELCKF